MRDEKEYFDDIPDEKVPKDILELASHIVETKSGHFEPKKFEDQYEDALKKLIRKKHSGKPIEMSERREPARVINLMDALRRRVEAKGKPPAGQAAERRRAPKKAGRSGARHKKAG